MFRPKMLLKVVSILFIIAGVLGLIGTVTGYVMIPKMSEIPGVDMSVLEAAYTPLNLIISIVSSIGCAGAGIFGVSGKSMKWALIFAGVYTVLLIVSIIQTIVQGTFTAFSVVNIILPALYWWGLYQSKE